MIDSYRFCFPVFCFFWRTLTHTLSLHHTLFVCWDLPSLIIFSYLRPSYTCSLPYLPSLQVHHAAPLIRILTSPVCSQPHLPRKTQIPDLPTACLPSLHLEPSCSEATHTVAPTDFDFTDNILSFSPLWLVTYPPSLVGLFSHLPQESILQPLFWMISSTPVPLTYTCILTTYEPTFPVPLCISNPIVS